MAEGNRIPTRSREIVARRSRGRCERCGGPGSEWHHRRRRRVRLPHQHCPCNGVYLCMRCHRWAHANPHDAAGQGFIVAERVENPGSIPLLEHGVEWVEFACDGEVFAV